MKKNIISYIFTIALFFSMAHSHLEAVSETPTILVVSCVRGALNSVTLSTNTLGVSLDIEVTDTGHSTEQLIGVVEWNATQLDPSPLLGSFIQISQIENAYAVFGDSGYWGCFTSSCGDASASTTIATGTAIKIYTNVSLSSTDKYIYTSPREVFNFSPDNRTLLTTWTQNTYCGQIGMLTFYAVDDLNNSLDPGTYRGSFIIEIFSFI